MGLCIQDHSHHLSSRLQPFIPKVWVSRWQQERHHRNQHHRQQRFDTRAEFDPVYSYPNIRLVPAYNNMPADPFPVTLHPVGINSTPIQIERAIEGDVAANLILESVAKEFGAKPVPYAAKLGQYNIVGQIESDWRRRERAEERWSTSPATFFVTPGPLPENAQAVISSGTSPPRQSGSMVAPVHQVRQTTREKQEAEAKKRESAEKRRQEKEASQQKLAQEYHQSKKDAYTLSKKL